MQKLCSYKVVQGLSPIEAKWQQSKHDKGGYFLPQCSEPPKTKAHDLRSIRQKNQYYSVTTADLQYFTLYQRGQTITVTIQLNLTTLCTGHPFHTAVSNSRAKPGLSIRCPNNHSHNKPQQQIDCFPAAGQTAALRENNRRDQYYYISIRYTPGDCLTRYVKLSPLMLTEC